MSAKIIVEYEPQSGLLGSIFDDGACGWLDIENQNGETETVKLKFKKKNPEPKVIPLEPGIYRITHRTQSKVAMLASDILININDSRDDLAGVIANSIYNAGGNLGTFHSAVFEVNENFVLKLCCRIDGTNKICQVVLCE